MLSKKKSQLITITAIEWCHYSRVSHQLNIFLSTSDFTLGEWACLNEKTGDTELRVNYVSRLDIIQWYHYRLTIVITIAIPEKTRGCLFSSGKCGSSIPVTGFRSTVGAKAANVGRGRS